MPTVPKISQNQVAPSALPRAYVNVEAPIEAFGGGQVAKVGDAVSELGQAGFKLAKQFREEAIKTKTAYNKNLIDNNFIMPNYKENGIFTMKGKDALDAENRFDDEFGQYIGKLQEEAADQDERDILERLKLEYSTDYKKKLAINAAKELDEFKKNEFSVLTKNSASLAALNHTDDNFVRKQAEAAYGATVEYQTTQGNREIAKDMANVERSKVIKESVERFLGNNDISSARAKKEMYLKENLLTGDDAKALEESIYQKEKDYRSMTEAEIINARFDDLGAKMDAANQTDPEIRDQVIRRVKSQHEIKTKQNEYAYESKFADALKMIEAGGSVDNIPAEIKMNMKKEHQDALMQYQAEKGGATSRTVDKKAMAKFSDLSQDDIARMPVSEFMSKYYMNATDGQRTLMKQTRLNAVRAKNGNAEAKLAFDAGKDDQQVMVQTLSQLEIGSFKKTDNLKKIGNDTEKSQAFSDFKEKANDRISETQARLNRKLTKDERAQVIKQTAKDQSVTLDGFFSDKTVLTSQVSESDVSRVMVPSNYEMAYIRAAKNQGIVSQGMSDVQAKKALGDRLKKAYLLDKSTSKSDPARNAAIIQKLRGN